MITKRDYKVYQVLSWDKYMYVEEIRRSYNSKHEGELGFGGIYTSLRHLISDDFIEVIKDPNASDDCIDDRMWKKKPGGNRPPKPASLEGRTDEGFSGELAPALIDNKIPI